MTVSWEEHARRLGLDPATMTPKVEARRSLSKFRNRRTRYDGRSYDSERESRRAAELDVLMASGVIRWWYPQPQIFLGPGRIPYRPDFLIIDDKGFYFEDVKGYITQRTRDIARLWRAHGPSRLLVVHEDSVRVIDPRVGGEDGDQDHTRTEGPPDLTPNDR